MGTYEKTCLEVHDDTHSRPPPDVGHDLGDARNLRCRLTSSVTTRSSRLAIVRVVHPTAEKFLSFGEAVKRGLSAKDKWLPFQYFYDALGSDLFEQICDLPEYYLTRTEDRILRDHAEAMVRGWDEPPAIIELGSGSSTKTQRLIGASLEVYGRLHYVPIDVSPTILEASARSLVDDFPRLRVTGYAGDYRVAMEKAFARFQGPKLVVFLGSSLGNYETDEAVDLLARIARGLKPTDRLLLGTDLIKDQTTLESAYDDAAGLTAKFNKNLLVRINRELSADFNVDRFAHRARFRADRSRVEMHLVSLEDQVVRVPGAGLTATFTAGEAIHTESSHKYSLANLQDIAHHSGFDEESAWTDPAGWFRVQRWRPR